MQIIFDDDKNYLSLVFHSAPEADNLVVTFLICVHQKCVLFDDDSKVGIFDHCFKSLCQLWIHYT
jgi:hypothetical protein